MIKENDDDDWGKVVRTVNSSWDSNIEQPF